MICISLLARNEEWMSEWNGMSVARGVQTSPEDLYLIFENFYKNFKKLKFEEILSVPPPLSGCWKPLKKSLTTSQSEQKERKIIICCHKYFIKEHILLEHCWLIYWAYFTLFTLRIFMSSYKWVYGIFM